MTYEPDERTLKKFISFLLDIYQNKKLPVLKVLNEYSEIMTGVDNMLYKGYLEKFEENEKKFYRLTEKGLEFVTEMIKAAEERKENQDKENQDKEK